MSKEMILVIAAITFVILAFYVFNKIEKLAVSKRYKKVLYFITAIVPLLGLYLVSREKDPL